MRSQEDLQDMSRTSCSVLNGMGPRIQWVESQVTDDKIYFTYTIRDHAEQDGFPASRVSEVRQAIDSTIAEA